MLNAKRMPVRKHEQILVFGHAKTYNPQGLTPLGKVTRQGGSSENYGRRSGSEYFQEFSNYPRDVLEVASEGGRLTPLRNLSHSWST